MTTKRDPQAIKLEVVQAYTNVARNAASCCGPKASPSAERYAKQEIESLPESTVNAMAGCGTPVDVADLQPGETVLDLGSGGGADVFLAAAKVGPHGKIIGVDMTPDMVQLARTNAKKIGAENVQFRLAEIEALPIPTDSVDAIVSNCVINLVPDKLAALREAWRVLRPGGRVVLSDVVRVGPLSDDITGDGKAWATCVAGAVTLDEYRFLLEASGFNRIQVQGGRPSEDAEGWRKSIANAVISARKPAMGRCCG